MKDIIKIFTIFFIVALSGSCTDYLDKAPESTITEKEVFGNFASFQGWVEQMYSCMANPHQRLGGDFYHTFNQMEMLTTRGDLEWEDGDYWSQRFLYWSGDRNLSGNSGVMSKFVWPLAWYAIRMANLGLQNLELMEGTQEEKDLIKGQCLYFRAWYHLELIQYWGGLPYVDAPLDIAENIAMPRLTYQETAMRISEDFEAAARLLPLSWKQTNTLVKDNDAVRVTRIHALGYKGKNLLHAASPLMNESSTGVNAYDAELCKQAAAAFDEVIRLCEQDGSKFKLESWANWQGIFCINSTTARPGGTEVIQNQPIYETGYTRWTTTRAASPTQWNAGNNAVEVPSHHYVKYYHMANGLPIDDPYSGFDENDPWTGREPRFYNDIIFEGARMVINPASTPARQNEFAQLSNTGRHRHGTTAAGTYAGSLSGYYYKKFLPLGYNEFDGWKSLSAYQPRLRMSDIYLMYAEAVYYGYGSASSRFPDSPYTAQSAIEKIRDRAQLPPLPNSYYSAENFMETLIRERAVEFAFEGHRWFDLRRWNIATELKYKQKTAIDFDLDAAGKPINFSERVVRTHVFEKRHNWVPFQLRFTKMHEGFEQNPGW
jgi:hypothetical protein